MTDSSSVVRTMRAAVMTGPGRLEIREVPRPDPGPGQVRVRLEGCGVCASNLTPWAGPEWMDYPTAPGGLGHEGWGRIDALGAGADAWRLGQRVATLSGNSYAEYDLAAVDQLVELPSPFDDLPFPGEPFGCAMNIYRRSRIEAGQTVAIIGIGFLGAILTRLATEAGARVVAISRRPSSLALAREMGAAEVIALQDHYDIIRRVTELTQGRFCERTIEAVGNQWPLDLAAELTGERGRLVVAGYHQDGPRQVNMQLWNWRGLDVINAHERDPAVYARGVREALSWLAETGFDPRRLVTHRYTLEQLDQALDDTRDRPDGFVKAMVTYQ